MRAANPARYLLIVGCSQRKSHQPGFIPALERYDGVNFRVLRKARREGRWPENLEVLILSAKHGLITADTLLEYYDEPMTPRRAEEIGLLASAQLEGWLNRGHFSQVFVNLGRLYREALSGVRLSSGQTVIYATGGIGKMMSDMKRWLHLVAGGKHDGAPD